MATSTYFNNIREHILTHLNQAEHNIIVCVAWLTDESILKTLVDKSKNKVHIQIITQNDEYNRAKASYFNKLIANNSKVYLLDKNITGGILHHKFCVIDDEVLITGSYNWTNNATNNIENVIIKTMDDENTEIIFSYTAEFQKILYQYGIKNEEEEWDKALSYIEETTKVNEIKFNEAKEFYDKAFNSWRLDKFETALEFVNEAISKAPYDVGDFYLLRHLTLRDTGKYIESFDDLVKCLDCLVIGQEEKAEQVKKVYDQFINTIKSAMYSFRIITEINEKTDNNSSSFKNWGITPHIFTFDELDPLPF